jgi:PIN domain nuclease of toxin-antitoxin system
MRLLLDTHALLWWLGDDAALGAKARETIADQSNAIFVSAASLWEIAVKQALGKLEADIAEIEQAVVDQGFERLGIEAAHVIELAGLPQHHRDPFDRMLVAQARSSDLVLLTADAQIAGYSVDRVAADR